MKLTKQQLKEIIKEELTQLNELGKRISKPEPLLKGKTIKSVQPKRNGHYIMTFEDGLVIELGIGDGNDGDVVWFSKV
jgi:hypothetical protein